MSALDTEGDIEVGVWEHSVGTSTDTEVEEVFVVLSGRGTVTCDQGGEILLEPGTVGMLPLGAKTVWSDHRALAKSVDHTVVNEESCSESLMEMIY